MGFRSLRLGITKKGTMELGLGLGNGIWAKFELGNGIYIPPFRTLFLSRAIYLFGNLFH